MMEAKSKTIDFYGAQSPNVVKVHIMIKELGNVSFTYTELNIRKGDQYSADFLQINPNGKLPAIVDHDVEGESISVFESGNILYYLANKFERFIPNMKEDPKGHNEVLNWVFWEMSNLSPVFANYYHFNVYAMEKHQYSIQRFGNELRRLLHVLNKNLENRQYIASNNEFTIADMAIYCWVRYISILSDFEIQEFPHLLRWLSLIKKRPSVVEWEEFEEEERKKSSPKFPNESDRKILIERDRNILQQTQKSIPTTQT